MAFAALHRNKIPYIAIKGPLITIQNWRERGRRLTVEAFPDQRSFCNRSFAEVAIFRQRLFILAPGPDLQLFWSTEIITAP